MELSVHLFRPINDLVFSLTWTVLPINNYYSSFIIYKNHVVQTFKMNVAVWKLTIPSTLWAVLMFEEELCWTQISGAPACRQSSAWQALAVTSYQPQLRSPRTHTKTHSLCHHYEPAFLLNQSMCSRLMVLSGCWPSWCARSLNSPSQQYELWERVHRATNMHLCNLFVFLFKMNHVAASLTATAFDSSMAILVVILRWWWFKTISFELGW